MKYFWMFSVWFVATSFVYHFCNGGYGFATIGILIVALLVSAIILRKQHKEINK